MGVTMLRLEGKRVKWRIKMMQAFEQKGIARTTGSDEEANEMRRIKGRALGVAVAPSDYGA